MDGNFDNPGRLESLSLIVAASFIPLSLISAVIWPVSGLPLWGKGLFTGLFFLAVYASFRKRRRDDAARSRQAAAQGGTPAPPGEVEPASDADLSDPLEREERLPGGDRP